MDDASTKIYIYRSVSPVLNSCTSVVTVFCASSASQARRFATDIDFGLIMNDGTTE